jgi:hypothetical protein
VRHRAVGVEAGDGREAQADEAGPPRARAELLVDRQLGDRSPRAERGLEPGVELAHRGAVLGHRLADEARPRRGLAALGQRARVDRLDTSTPAGHGLAQAERDALGVDSSVAPAAARPARPRPARSTAPAAMPSAASFAPAPARPCPRRRTAWRAARIEQQVGQEHRVVVTSAPRRLVIQAMSSTVETKWCVAPACASPRARRRAWRRAASWRAAAVLVDRRAGSAGRSGQTRRAGRGRCAAHAGGVQRGFAAPRRRPAQHLAVDRHRAARAARACQPVDVRQARRRRWGSSPARCRCRPARLGLHPVAAVGEQRRASTRDHQRAHRAGEAADSHSRPASGRAGTPTGAGRSTAQ